MTLFVICAVISVFLFFAVKWFAWFSVDYKGWIPEFIDYKPYKCSFCLAFWTNLILSIGLMFISMGFIFLAGLAVFDAVAYFVDRKQNTITLLKEDENDE